MNYREERLLLLMPEYVWGGAETQFRLLIEYAEKHGWKLDVIIEHKLQYAERKTESKTLKMKNVRFFELNEYGKNNERLVFDITGCIFRNLFRVQYTACLIQHTPDLIVAPILYLFGIKVVYSERNDAALIKQNAVYRRCLKYCRHITANSRYAQSVLEKMTTRKVRFIRNGKPVTEALVEKDNRGIQNILVPCRIFPVKNQMMVLHFMRDCRDFEGKVIFAGRVEDKSYYKKLKGFVHKNHLEDRVEFKGQVEDMRSLYQLADLVVLPSFVEGTPNIILESYMYCRPVIVSDTNTVRDIVRDPMLRFSLKDAGGIERCVKYVKNLPETKYKHMLQKNREYVIAKYNVEKMADSYFKLLSNNECQEMRGNHEYNSDCSGIQRRSLHRSVS